MQTFKVTALAVQSFRGLELLVQFLLTVLVARMLDPGDFGQAGIVLSLATVLLVLTAFGFDELAQREIAQKPENASDILRSAVVFRSGAVSIFAAVAIPVVTYTLGTSEGVLCAWGAIWAASMSFSSLAVAVGTAKRNALFPLAASASGWVIPLVIIQVVHLESAQDYLAILAIGGIFRLLCSFGYLLRTGLREGAVKRRRVLLDRSVAHASITFYNANNQVLSRHGDVVVAGILSISLALIGTYGIAFQIAATANTFLMIGLGAVGLSDFSSKAHDRDWLRARWLIYSRASAWLAFGPLLILILLSPDLDQYVFEAKYPQFVPVFISLVVAQWVNRIAGGGTNIGTLIALGDSREVGRSSTLGALANISANFALIPIIGVYGCAVGTAAATALSGYLNQRRLRASLRAKAPATLYMFLSAALLLGIGVVFAPTPDVIRYSAAGIVLFVWGTVSYRARRSFDA